MTSKTFPEESLPSADSPVRWAEILTRAYAPSLALVSLAVWLHASTNLLVATMLNSILDEIGGEAVAAWSVAIYLVGSITAGSVAGLTARRFGPKAPMAAAATLFAAGCALSAAAPNMGVVLAGRLLQGAGGGGMMALSFVAIGILFPPRLASKAVAVASTLWGCASLSGPLVGSIFVEFLDWRAGFAAYALQALALAAWLLVWDRRDKANGIRARAEVPAEGPSRPPFLRLCVIAAGVLLIAWAGLFSAPWQVAAMMAAGLVALIGALRLDAAAGGSRMFPRRAFDPLHRSGSALALTFFLAFSTVGIVAYGPVLLIRLHETSEIGAGYMLGVASISWSVAAVTVSSLPPRRDPWVISIGALLVLGSLPFFALTLSQGPVWGVYLTAMVEGMGFGMAWTFILRRAQQRADEADGTRMASSLTVSQQLGYAAGAAVAGAVANAAGFAPGADHETLSHVAAAIFLAPLPAAALALIALRSFARR